MFYFDAAIYIAFIGLIGAALCAFGAISHYRFSGTFRSARWYAIASAVFGVVTLLAGANFHQRNPEFGFWGAPLPLHPCETGTCGGPKLPPTFRPVTSQ